jgi:hypothetical protein
MVAPKVSRVSQPNQRVTERRRRGARFALPEPRQWPSDLRVVADAGSSRYALPPELKRRAVAHVIQPCSLARPVPVRVLPDRARPNVPVGPDPTHAHGTWQAERAKRRALRGVFENTAPALHRRKCRREAPAVIARAVVLATPPRIVQRREPSPKLARRMSHNGMWPDVRSRVADAVPRINTGHAEVRSTGFDEQRGY